MRETEDFGGLLSDHDLWADEDDFSCGECGGEFMLRWTIMDVVDREGKPLSVELETAKVGVLRRKVDELMHITVGREGVC